MYRNRKISRPLALLGMQTTFASGLIIPAAILGVARAFLATFIGIGVAIVRIDWILRMIPT